MAAVTDALGIFGRELWPLSSLPAAVLAWVAGVLVLPRVDQGTRRVAGVLLLLGISCAALAWSQGFGPDTLTGLGRAFTINLPILALFLGVAFLGLLPAEASRSEARGMGLLGVLLSVHLVGAVINLAAAALVGDSFARNRREAPRLTRAEALAITRPYCAAAFWSPFFVATAVAQTYAPSAKASVTLPLGFLAAAGALLITYLTLRREGAGAHLGAFQLGRRALWLTAVLLLAVLGGKAIYPEVSVVVMVATLAPPLAFLGLPRGQWASGDRLSWLRSCRRPRSTSCFWLPGFSPLAFLRYSMAGLLGRRPGGLLLGSGPIRLPLRPSSLLPIWAYIR